MSGVRRCKEFLHNLSEEERKKIRVKIKRPGIPDPDIALPFYRGLEDPKTLVIHFKKEALRGIFDREDIVLNQEFPEETSKKDSRECERRSSSIEDTSRRKTEKSRSVSYHHESSRRNREDRGRSYRSRSRSSDRYRRKRSRSGSVKRRSKSPLRKDEYSRRPYSGERKRSRSYSPLPQPKKTPGLFIPTESDYLRYKKRKTDRSRSPVPKYSSKESGEHSSRVDMDKHRSPRKRSRTPPRRKRSCTPPRGRRSRSPSRGRRSRTRSPASRRSRRSRSRSRHGEREIEHLTPYMFQDGKYWIPVSPFIPRGFIPPPHPQLLYPRPFPPPMMMRPNMMQPYRQKLFRPRQHSFVPDVATTSKVVQITEVDGNDESKPQESSETQ